MQQNVLDFAADAMRVGKSSDQLLAGKRLAALARTNDYFVDPLWDMAAHLRDKGYDGDMAAYGDALKLFFDFTCYAPSSSDLHKLAVSDWAECLRLADRKTAIAAVVYAHHHRTGNGDCLKDEIVAFREDYGMDEHSARGRKNWENACNAAKAKKLPLKAARLTSLENDTPENAKEWDRIISDVPDSRMRFLHVLFTAVAAHRAEATHLKGAAITKFESSLSKMLEVNPEFAMFNMERPYKKPGAPDLSFKEVFGESLAGKLLKAGHDSMPKIPSKDDVRVFCFGRAEPL